VWQALPRFPVWHFACHCRAEPEAILDSALILAGGELTLRSLLRLPPSPRRLAVLSACDSHRSGRDLPDEAMGLPGGLLQVGLAGVIATHWRADDRAAAFLTTKFYELWREQGLAPAYALAGAQRWLRQATHGELDSYLPGVLTPPANAAPEDWARWARARPCAHAHRWASFAISGT
jgi:CHAT domain-containing protein